MKATWKVFDSYLQGTQTYTTDAMRMLLDHTYQAMWVEESGLGMRLKACHVLL